MTHTISDLLGAASARAVPVVGAVPDDRLGAATPCAEYDVRALLNHLFSVVVNFQALAAKGDTDLARTPDRVADDGWRERFAAETGRLAAAWAAPGAEEGTAGRMEMPARTVGSLAVLDLTVHGWDLARSVGVPFTPDPACVTEMTALLDGLAPTARRMGVFAEPAPVPADASPFDRLLAATGRDPGWRPPARD
ncbi:TIGR03086 family metal-binding protein [Streptomyces sp. NPDC054784]